MCVSTHYCFLTVLITEANQLKKNACQKSFPNWIMLDSSKQSDHQRYCKYSVSSTFRATYIAISMPNWVQVLSVAYCLSFH